MLLKLTLERPSMGVGGGGEGGESDQMDHPIVFSDLKFETF